MDFNNVLNGVIKFVEREVIGGMNPWQEIIARVAMARVTNNANRIKAMLVDNAFSRALAVSDENGNIDVDGLVCDLKKAISAKGSFEIEVPLFGRFKFIESDVDKLNSYIRGG